MKINLHPGEFLIVRLVKICLVTLLLSYIALPARSQQSPSTPGLRITKDSKVWMLTYFRQRYPTRIEIDSAGRVIEVPLENPMLLEKLHIALSTDGRHWTPLNNNKPVSDQFMRDPHVHRRPDGVWRVLSTGGSRSLDRKKVGPGCLYISSKDLIHWEPEIPLPLMKDVRNDTGAFARNIWAPEWFFDKKSGEYMLLWSSSFEDAGWKKSRIWYCKTKDWKTFTPAKELFHPSYSAIDGTMLENNGTYYLFHKEEEFGVNTGERRAIRVAISKNPEGPYTVLDGNYNKGQIVPVITEGPSVIQDPINKNGWLLLYDYCMTDRFGASSSTDLKNWKVEENVSFPAAARHGSISQLTAAEAEALLKAFPVK